ncbi:MAG: DUF86 domain-containing protein [Cyclobacteriaceae bacterium]
MTDKEKKYLSDMLNSIHHILSFTEGVTSFEIYKGNFLIKGAVERHLGIIGEAVNKFLKESPENNLINAKQIISLRNRLIHSYDNVDDRIIWNVVKMHLLPFKNEIEGKLN